jgi:hypothetical protein
LERDVTTDLATGTEAGSSERPEVDAGGGDAAERDARPTWGADFDPDRLALLEFRMWKAYYRRQPARLFGLLVQALGSRPRSRGPGPSTPPAC